MYRKETERHKNRAPVRLGDLLGTKGSATEKLGLLSELKKTWCLVSGGLAAFSFPYRLKDETLYVAVREPVWIAELPYLKGELLEKLAQNGLEVKDIRFTLAKARMATKNVTLPQERPLTEEERNFAEQTSRVLEDNELKVAFKDALLASLAIERTRLAKKR